MQVVVVDVAAVTDAGKAFDAVADPVVLGSSDFENSLPSSC